MKNLDLWILAAAVGAIVGAMAFDATHAQVTVTTQMPRGGFSYMTTDPALSSRTGVVLPDRPAYIADPYGDNVFGPPSVYERELSEQANYPEQPYGALSVGPSFGVPRISVPPIRSGM